MNKTVATVYYRIGNEPASCKYRMKNAFAKLDKNYGKENKIIINDLDTDLRKTLTSISQVLGFPTTSSFLEVYGYKVDDSWKDKYILNFENHRDDEMFIRYPVGFEPTNIKNRIDRLMNKIDDAYPNRTIIRLQKEHRKWYETVCELRQILGYDDIGSFFEAYGYAYEKASNAIYKDEELIEAIKIIKKRYKNKQPETSIVNIFNNNKDLEKYYSPLVNRSYKLFHSTLGNYLISINVLKNGSLNSKEMFAEIIEEFKKRYPNGAKHCNLKNLFDDNPDLGIYEKSMREKCESLYGTNLISYLQENDVLQKSRKQIIKEIDEEYGSSFEMNKSRTQILKYIGSEKEVVIPPFIKKIEKEAFANTKVKKIVFEKDSNCTLIKEKAFNNCKSLSEVIVASELDINIRDDAFKGCDNLELIIE